MHGKRRCGVVPAGAATCASSITAPPLISSPQVAHAPSCHCVRAAAAADAADADDALPFAAAVAAAAAANDCTGGDPAATRSATRGASSVKPAANSSTTQVPKIECSPATVCIL